MNLKSIVSSYGGHLAGYVVSAAGIVAGLNPKLVPPQYAWLTSVAGLVVIGAHHGYTAGQASGVVKAAADAAAAALSKVPPAAAVALVALLGFGGLSGCATVEGFFASPQSQPVIVIAVDVAVATAEQKGVPADKINAIAKAALVADSSPNATLGAVAALVNVEIGKLNLPPLDLIAAQTLEMAITQAIDAQIGKNPNVATAQANVATILAAVIAATGG